MRFASTIILLFLMALASPGIAQAHGGEDHGDAPAPRSHTFLAVLGTGATGDLFEAVVTSVPNRNGLVIHLADLESNAPVENAVIEAEMAGSSP